MKLVNKNILRVAVKEAAEDQTQYKEKKAKLLIMIQIKT